MVHLLSYHDLLRWRESQITNFYTAHPDQSISVVLGLAFICLPVLGLVISGNRMLRLATFGLTACLGILIICNVRTIYPGNGYHIGLLASSWILQVAVRLLLRNPRRDFQRLQYSERPIDQHQALQLENGRYIRWQPYPEILRHRVSWAVDLLFTMRGGTWNWRIGSMRPLPAPLQDSVLYPRLHTHSYWPAIDNTIPGLFLQSLKSLVILGILNSFGKRDPYFWGIMQTPPLAESPLYMLHQWPLAIRTYRMLLCYAAILHGLTLLMTTMQIVRLVIARAGGCMPYDQPWANASLFGDVRAVLDHGLAGFWGSYWHQLYRFDALTCSSAVLACFSSWVRHRPITRQIIRMLVTFFLMGVVHACACYTQIGPTRPIRGILTFFMLQSLGIILQMIVLSILPPRLRDSRLGPVANFVWVFLWFLACSPLLFDEYVSGGLFVEYLNLPDSLSDTLSPTDGHAWHRLNVHLRR